MVVCPAIPGLAVTIRTESDGIVPEYGTTHISDLTGSTQETTAYLSLMKSKKHRINFDFQDNPFTYGQEQRVFPGKPCVFFEIIIDDRKFSHSCPVPDINDSTPSHIWFHWAFAATEISGSIEIQVYRGFRSVITYPWSFAIDRGWSVDRRIDLNKPFATYKFFYRPLGKFKVYVQAFKANCRKRNLWGKDLCPSPT
jgi:hypothetical protein